MRALLCAVMARAARSRPTVSRCRDPRLHAHAARAGRALAALSARLFRDVRARLGALRRSPTPRQPAAARFRRAGRQRLPVRSRRASPRDLGFDGITRNSMDVSGDRDFALDFLYAASVTMIHLSRLAEDWILYSSEEFGWLELGDGVTSGSQPHAAEEESRFARTDPRQERARDGLPHLAAGHHEGPAHDLQSRHAGGQGTAVRRRRPGDRLAAK